MNVRKRENTSVVYYSVSCHPCSIRAHVVGRRVAHILTTHGWCWSPIRQTRSDGKLATIRRTLKILHPFLGTLCSHVYFHYHLCIHLYFSILYFPSSPCCLPLVSILHLSAFTTPLMTVRILFHYITQS